MAETGLHEDAAESVTAGLTYTANTGEKPSTGATAESENLAWHSWTRNVHEFAVRNARKLAGKLSLEREGFELVRHETAVKDFYDEDEIRRVYYPEIEALVKRVSGANKVHVFDHTLRTASEALQEEKGARGPVMAVHNDYTEWSGPQRVRDLFPPDEAARLLKHRVAVIQVWRPINKPVEESPLAICDARSLDPADLIPADRRYPDRVGEIYQIAVNPKHAWFYFPHMRRDEAVVFKCYDSLKDGRARFTAHTAFTDPTSPTDAPPRESIEMRTLAFWAPDA